MQQVDDRAADQMAGVPLDVGDEVLEPVLFGRAVVVGEDEEGTGRVPRSLVARRRGTATLLAHDGECELVVEPLECRRDRLRAAVVTDDHLELVARQRLRGERLEAALELGDPAMRRNDDRYRRVFDGAAFIGVRKQLRGRSIQGATYDRDERAARARVGAGSSVLKTARPASVFPPSRRRPGQLLDFNPRAALLVLSLLDEAADERCVASLLLKYPAGGPNVSEGTIGSGPVRSGGGREFRRRVFDTNPPVQTNVRRRASKRSGQFRPPSSLTRPP